MSMRPDPITPPVQALAGLNWQTRRGRANAARLCADLRVLAMVHGAIPIGPDEVVGDQFDRVQLGPDAVALERFRLFRTATTIAVPTFRTWSCGKRRRLTYATAEAALATGRIVLVASPLDVILQPRLANAITMLRRMRPPAIGDAEAVRERIVGDGGTTKLGICAETLASPFAMNRIFGLMVGGVLEIDFSVPLGPESMVRLNPDDRPCEQNVAACMFLASVRSGGDLARRSQLRPADGATPHDHGAVR